jgi:hypothetical protein
MSMARRVYADLRNMHRNGAVDGDPAGPANPSDAEWQNALPAVERFIWFTETPGRAGGRYLANVTETFSGLDITQQSLINKIRILFPGFTIPADLNNIDRQELLNFSNANGHTYGSYRSYSIPHGGQVLMGLGW